MNNLPAQYIEPGNPPIRYGTCFQQQTTGFRVWVEFVTEEGIRPWIQLFAANRARIQMPLADFLYYYVRSPDTSFDMSNPYIGRTIVIDYPCNIWGPL